MSPKPALSFYHKRGEPPKQNQQSLDIPSAYQVLGAKVLAEIWLFTHSTNTELPQHPTGVFIFLLPVKYKPNIESPHVSLGLVHESLK